MTEGQKPQGTALSKPVEINFNLKTNFYFNVGCEVVQLVDEEQKKRTENSEDKQ
jgi:hypothetical protein